MELKEGISVIVPTYKGEKYIETLLNSLKKQTLDYKLFEIIIVVNGELDETPNIIKNFQVENPKMNIILENSEKGVSYARNKAISIANYEYLVFIDDDDFVSPNYLKTFLKNSKPNRIIIGSFLDVYEDTGKITDTLFNQPIFLYPGVVKNINDIAPTPNIITAKLIPTAPAKENSFNTNLKNGEDLIYALSLYAKNDFEFYCLNKDDDAIYYRLFRDNSLSRPKPSYEFIVSDRLKIMKELYEIFKIATNPDLKIYIIKLFCSRVSDYMVPYIKEHPEDLERFIAEVDIYNFEYFPYWYFNEIDLQTTKELIVSNTFPTKTIVVNGKPVDVITENPTDDDVALSFAHEIIEFDNVEEILTYERIRTIDKHIEGFFYKISHETYWIAEFTDNQKKPVYDEDLVRKINNIIPQKFNKVKENEDINKVAIYLAFIISDELIFYSENQRDAMVDEFPELKEVVLPKSKIVETPILGEFYYYIHDSNYSIDNDYINFAYFGEFNKNTHLEDFIAGFTNLDDKFKDKFRLHIFAPNIEAFKKIIPSEILDKTKYTYFENYFQFLNLTTKMDVLLLDASLLDISDFLGSGVDIWAIDSNMKYNSNSNDLNSSKNTINQIMSDKLNFKVEIDDLNKDEIIEYYNKRYYHILNAMVDLNDEVSCSEIQRQLQENKDKVNFIRKFMRPRFVFNLLRKLRNYLRRH